MTAHFFARTLRALFPLLAALLCVLLAPPRALAYATVHHFAGSFADGSQPVSGLVQDAGSGNYYGTTKFGGKYGQGTVFCLDPNFGFTLLYSFAGGTDGANPTGTLFLLTSPTATSGTLYGTTLKGGSAGLGTVYRISTSGAGYGILHSFTGAAKDGANPYAGVIFTSNKLLYGTTLRGGAFDLGTVYSLSPGGGSTTIRHSFSGLTAGVAPDGATPYARLLEFKAGILAGTTALGGQAKQGIVYRIALSGSPYQILHTFAGSDGANPTAEVIQFTDPAGRVLLYGTTVNGGRVGQGTAYHINSGGTNFATVYDFMGSPDGANPWGGLLAGRDGNLYGTTLNGGAFNVGTVYGLTPSASLPYSEGVVYSFQGGFAPSGVADGSHPYDTLFQSVTDGQLYGTCSADGKFGDGTVFHAP